MLIIKPTPTRNCRPTTSNSSYPFPSHELPPRACVPQAVIRSALSTADHHQGQPQKRTMKRMKRQSNHEGHSAPQQVTVPFSKLFNTGSRGALDESRFVFSWHMHASDPSNTETPFPAVRLQPKPRPALLRLFKGFIAMLSASARVQRIVLGDNTII